MFKLHINIIHKNKFKVLINLTKIFYITKWIKVRKNRLINLKQNIIQKKLIIQII